MNDEEGFRLDLWTVLFVVLVLLVALVLTFELWIGHDELPHS